MTRAQETLVIGRSVGRSSELVFPLSAVTETFSILGQRGSGKTSCATVVAEEMLEQRQRVVVVDPLGVWWGLRASAAGKADGGYPVIIFGGDHADLPLEPQAGELIANLVVSQHIACVLDLSHMRKAEQRTFMTAFTETLYHRNRDPLHLMVDEADLYAGQRPPKGAERLLGAMEDLVRRGRARGIGMTLITQRPAVIHKDVLSQTSVLVAFRVVSPQDTAALDAWVKQHDVDDQRRTFLDSLPSLPTGTAWVWSPSALGLFDKVAVRRRRTFDSSSTPQVGQTRQTPREYAPVDLDALRSQMSEIVERAEAQDPKTLQARIRSLEAELAKRPSEVAVVERMETVTVEVPVVGDEQVAALREAIAQAHEIAAAMSGAADALARSLDDATRSASRHDSAPRAVVPARPAEPQPEPRASNTGRPATPAPASAVSGGTHEAYQALRSGARRMLDQACAFYPNWLSKAQLAALAGMKSKNSGTFQTYLGELKRLGFLETEGQEVQATAVGMEATGKEFHAPATAAELKSMWDQRLRAGARRMLETVIAAHPVGIAKDVLAAEVGLEPTAGTFQTYLGELRRFSLVEVKGGRGPEAIVVLGPAWNGLL